MKLHFHEEGEGAPLVILHGLFGSHRNWLPVTRELARDFRVVSVDLRNHGQSPHHDDMDYPTLAEDLRRFLDEHQLARVHLLGHSLGGKAAMQFALAHPERVRRLVVVDIAPRQYPSRHDDIFDGLRSLDLDRVGSRKEADAALADKIPDPGVRRFLLMNLVPHPERGLRWAVHLEALHRHRSKLQEAISSPTVFPGPTLFIRGGRSDYITDADLPMIRQLFPVVELATIREAGHWVHAEAPREFVAALREFLSQSNAEPV